VLHRAGLTVPGDISVIGYDDSRLARLSHVDLTTAAVRATLD
jgi:DNA-binding LacI/PurR family transcriptional regulator